jgi:integrase
MASLRKSPNSEKKFWIMIYRSADGRQHQVSSRLPATPAFRNQAMHMALELETAAKKKPAAELEHFSRQLNAHELSKKVLGIVEQSAPPPQLTKFKEMAERWLEGKRNRNSRSTFLRYQQVIQEFVRSIGTASLQYPVSHIHPHHIEKYLADLVARGQTPSNQRIKIKVLRSFFNRAKALHTITHDPTSPVELPAGFRNTREPFTPGELKTLLSVCTPEWRALILLGALAGLRLGDAANLTWQNVDLEKRVIAYLPRKKRHLPNSKRIEVPIHPDLYEAILGLPVASKAPSTPLFPEWVESTSAGRNGLSMQFNELMAKAGVDPLPLRKKGQRTFQAKTFHSLRHTFVTLMAESGVSQELRKELAGHSSDVHRIYTHHSPSALRSAVDTIPSVI